MNTFDSNGSFLSPQFDDQQRNKPLLKILLTNSRSLAPKIDSLQDYFTEHEIDIAMITESWLKDGRVLDQDVIDLEHGRDLKIIYRNRPKKSLSNRAVGGGVSIIYNKTKCTLRERKIRGNKFELVAATGRLANSHKEMVFFCAYLEPRMKQADVREMNDVISDEILQIKAKSDPLIFLGGDLNKKCLDDAVSAFPNIKRVNFDPTRGQACLDVLYTDMSNVTSTVWPPLESVSGTKSDHQCVIFEGQLPDTRDFVWKKKTTRCFRETNMAVFGAKVSQTDWAALFRGNGGPDEMIGRYEAYMNDLVNALFPLKTTRYRSNESPWITQGIRRLSKQKSRVFKREGKSNLWRNISERLLVSTERSKQQYVDSVPLQQNPRGFYRAIKNLSARSPVKEWSLGDLFPNKSATEAGEDACKFFAQITGDFLPLREGDPLPQAFRGPVTVDQVRARLRSAKKPNSAVEGDLPPILVKKFHHLLAIPTTLIFNAIFATGLWPKKWKTETAVIIPKTPNPGSLSECRNISCTPFLSKVQGLNGGSPQGS